ncbi:uncharacterized protein BDV17DRAFT_196493 [Aspergillus undulatus]|uniref:uncharacterized protein n=1 Tax=Aspergillus undulatus TaxID=1810928 RepID=UPI003CCDF3FC
MRKMRKRGGFVGLARSQRSEGRTEAGRGGWRRRRSWTGLVWTLSCCAILRGFPHQPFSRRSTKEKDNRMTFKKNMSKVENKDQRDRSGNKVGSGAIELGTGGEANDANVLQSSISGLDDGSLSLAVSVSRTLSRSGEIDNGECPQAEDIMPSAYTDVANHSYPLLLLICSSTTGGHWNLKLHSGVN